MEKRLSEVTMAVAVPSREEGVAVPSPATAAEGAALPADDVLAPLAAERQACRGRSGTATAGGRPEHGALASVHALSVLASQLRSPLLMLLAVTLMAVVDQIEITG
jgi:hypothetical protein